MLRSVADIQKDLPALLRQLDEGSQNQAPDEIDAINKQLVATFERVAKGTSD